MTSPVRLLTRTFLATSLLVAGSSVASAQVLTVLHSFDSTDGSNPTQVTLVQGRDGNLRGTTTSDGQNGAGTLFAITPDGVLKYINFDGPHGAGPYGGPVLGVDGNYYGTTINGGTKGSGQGLGVVYKVSPTGNSVNILFRFDGIHGAHPGGSLIQGSDRNFYGTTVAGGDSTNCSGGCGTVFKITPNGTLTTLYNFDLNHGDVPNGGLQQGSDGKFYGTTVGGGSTNCPGGCGTVFKVTPAGQLTAVYSFTGGSDGAYPLAPLIRGSDGNFYGTTESTIFKISPSGTFTNLYTFTGNTEVAAPLAEGTDGNFYGVNAEGGSSGNCGTSGCGTIFQMTPSGLVTTLYNFSGSDGKFPEDGLMQYSNGKFYGTTEEGGTGPKCPPGCGTVYSLDMGLGSFVAFVAPFGRVGSGVQILGQGLTGTTSVTFDGIPATTFNVASDTFMEAIVPPGATTGPVQVTTPGGILTSNVNLQIVP